MKLALLISGEYRTFDSCRGNFPLIDEPDVDVYFSTWSTSTVKNERLGIDESRIITEDMVISKVGRPCSVILDDVEAFTEQKYNSKMMCRWIRGLTRIMASGIHYDAILICRPDMYFEAQPTSDDIRENSQCGFLLYDEGNNLQDCCFALSHLNASRLLQMLCIDDWVNSPISDWHTWWTNLVLGRLQQPTRLFPHIGTAFCRSLITQSNPTFGEVFAAFEIWRDVQIIEFMEKYNRPQTVKAWGEEIVRRAEDKLAAGFYSPKKDVSKDVAILVCGMLRGQYAEAYDSWKDLRKLNADWYLSTFNKSCESYSTQINEVSSGALSAVQKGYTQINVIELDTFTINKQHENTARHLQLLRVFSEKLKTYKRVIVIRPDSFVKIYNLGEFLKEIHGEHYLTNILNDDFVQDFMYVVDGKFFETIDYHLERVKETILWNPHQALLGHAQSIGKEFKQSSLFDVSLLRPNCRHKSNLNISEVANRKHEWDAFHNVIYPC